MLQRVFHADPTREQSSGVTPRLRVGLIVSAALHVAAILVLLLGLPSFTPEAEPPPETTVAMVFQGPAKASMKANAPAHTLAPSPQAAPPAPPVVTPPKQQPIETPPPPPPPPPPPQQAQVQPSPPIPTPPVPTPPALTPPTPPPSMPPPPPEPAPAPNVIPLPPAPPAPPTPTQTAKVEQPPLPVPPPLVPPPPSPPSTTSQPNPTKNAAADSKAIDNTLDKLRQQLAQSQPPRARPNPQAGGAGGGNPAGNDTAALSTDQRAAIGDHVRECWTKDAGALDIDKERVLLTVTTDASGVARQAVVAGNDIARLGDPRFRVFAERAVRAILNPRCANLPLPNKVLGKVNVLTFRFSP